MNQAIKVSAFEAEALIHFVYFDVSQNSAQSAIRPLRFSR